VAAWGWLLNQPCTLSCHFHLWHLRLFLFSILRWRADTQRFDNEARTLTLYLHKRRKNETAGLVTCRFIFLQFTTLGTPSNHWRFPNFDSCGAKHVAASSLPLGVGSWRLEILIKEKPNMPLFGRTGFACRSWYGQACNGFCRIDGIY